MQLIIELALSKLHTVVGLICVVVCARSDKVKRPLEGAAKECIPIVNNSLVECVRLSFLRIMDSTYVVALP